MIPSGHQMVLLVRSEVMKGERDGCAYEPGRITQEGDLVMAHGRYSGGGKTLVAVDIFRFEGDFIVEQWQVLQEEVPAVSRRITGPGPELPRSARA